MHNNNTILNAALLCLTALTSTPSLADITGRVVGVTDGDTITVLDNTNAQHKVRLAGIDAPEKKQPFGQKSKQSLSDCAYDRTATIQGDKLDRYGRLVGKVLVSGVDCNLRQAGYYPASLYIRFHKACHFDHSLFDNFFE